MKSKNRNNSFICICCSFLLAVFVTILGLLVSVKLGFATNNSISQALDQVKYADMVYDELLDKCESIAIPNALSREVFDGVFSKEMVNSDCKAYLDAQLNSKICDVDTTKAKEKLVSNINKYVKKNNLTADGDQEEIVNGFADDIMEYYTDAIQVPYAGQVGNIFRMISKYFMYICPIMLVFSAAIIYVLFKFNTRKKNRVFRYMAYSVMSGAFSVLIIPICCYISGFYKRLQIYPEYVYRFIVKYIENGLRLMTIIGIILAIAAGVMIAVSSYIKHKLKQGRSHR